MTSSQPPEVAGPAPLEWPADDITPLMDASRAVIAAVVRALAKVDGTITVAQMRVLVLLSTGEPLTLSAVADRLGVNASNASRTCDRLVTNGYVHRAEQRSDRRQIALTLTAQGRAFVSDLLRHREAELAAIVERMSSADRERLMLALASFNKAAESDVWPDGHLGVRDRRLLEWGI